MFFFLSFFKDAGRAAGWKWHGEGWEWFNVWYHTEPSAPSIDVGVRLQWQKFLSKALKAMQLPQMMPSHQTHPASTERASWFLQFFPSEDVGDKNPSVNSSLAPEIWCSSTSVLLDVISWSSSFSLRALIVNRPHDEILQVFGRIMQVSSMSLVGRYFQVPGILHLRHIINIDECTDRIERIPSRSKGCLHIPRPRVARTIDDPGSPESRQTDLLTCLHFTRLRDIG